MKLCSICGQSVAEEIRTCPSCGSEIGEGRRYIDDYRIVDVLHEGYSSFLCRAIREPTNEQAMIRLFTPNSGVNEEVAARLERELEQLKKLPGEGFVHHHAIKRSTDGLWYRVSEWIDSESWGSLLASGRLGDLGLLLDLFHQMASILSVLHHHGHFIPHLIMSDIIAAKGKGEELSIKIDYKLSRFIDPWLDRPSPMLKKLLSTHPDITNERPLDFKSDIWSLGKVFVELLSADLETTDYLGKTEELQVPPDLQVLLRVMLAQDPDLRPPSMQGITVSIQSIQARLSQQASTPSTPSQDLPSRPAGLIQRPQKRLWPLPAIVVSLFLVGLLIWLTQDSRRKDVEVKLEGYANQYARSVAFLLVEYWLDVDGKRVYRNAAEGTAFLVDRDGYMLTSRHVVCPWLEDSHFDGVVQDLQLQQISPSFGYRVFVWFEGERAFNRAGRMVTSPDLTDLYFVQKAFSTETSPRLRIAGVAKPPMRIRQLLTSPLKDDFALIKIEKTPPGLAPIPLDLDMDPRKLPKLSRVITLGFPLGSRTQTDTVNVSVVRGNIRRTFENMFQIDASLHGGNSGGPVIDARGKAIGIVSAVAMDFIQGLVPMVTPVWDIGLILPITDAVQLLKDLKAGQAKWNGVLDFSQEATLTKIRDRASAGRWAEAMPLADEALSESLQPGLVNASGMLHFCNGDYRGARLRFSQLLSMDAEDNQSRLMLVLIDWLCGARESNFYRQELLDADWRSSAEFQGYLVRILEGGVARESALKGWYNRTEKSWVYYISGLAAHRRGNTEEAINLLQEAAMSSDPDTWEFILSRAMIEDLRKEQRKVFATDDQWEKYAAQVERFEAVMRETAEIKKKRQAELAPLWAKLADGTVPLEEKRLILEKAHEIDAEDLTVLAALAYCTSALGEWSDALDYLRRFLKAEGRPNAVQMSLGLLEAGIIHYQGQESEAQQKLSDLSRRMRDPWFLSICEYLLGRQTEEFLRKQAGERPEDIITAYTMMAFWAEGAKDNEKAIRFYREALGTFLAEWLPYDFARERITRLKQAKD